MKTLSVPANNKESFYYKGFEFDGYSDNCVIYDTGKGLIVVDPGVRHHNEFNNKEIVATFITHGHWDHWIGVEKIKKGLVFTHPFVSELASCLGGMVLSNKLRHITTKNRHVFIDNVPVIIDVFNLFHSIPRTMGFVLQGKRARVVHLGDFKFNTITSFTKSLLIRDLRQISRKPVDFLVMTIFEADKEGFTPSEDPVLDNITDIIRESSGRVIIVSFASNLSRIKQLVYRVKMLGKLIGFEGMAMNFTREFIGFRDTKEWYPKEVIFTAGCQGEKRLFLDNDSSLDLRKSDTLIFSSQCMKGNEERLRYFCERLQESVGRIIVNKGEINRIGLRNIKNIEESFVHVSGHERLDGLRLVLDILKPKKVLCWPQTYPQIDYFRDVCEEFGIEIINESERIIEI